jgi:membrane protease subunit (stomatin/prohibitin family)
MSLGSFIKKQFIDVLQWNEDSDGTLAWRYPMEDFEIQYGASLTVRESQMAVFVNEGKVADVFGPGMYAHHPDHPGADQPEELGQALRVALQVGRVFLQHPPAARPQVGHAAAGHDPRQGFRHGAAARLRHVFVQAGRPAQFFTEISGTRASYTVDELEQQLRNLVVATMSATLGGADVPFLDMAANQLLLADKMREAMTPTFERYGLALDNFAVENISLPEELQKAIDARISMGMVGDLGKYTQFQVAQSVPLAAQNEGGLAGVGAGLAAGVGMGQVMMDALRGSQAPAGRSRCRRPPPTTRKPASPSSRRCSTRAW